MKVFALIFALLATAQMTMAQNVVPDGSYSGRGTWGSKGPAGTFGGTIQLWWTQNGEIGRNRAILSMNGNVVQQFQDRYRFRLVEGAHYQLSRFLNDKYVQIGETLQTPAGYSSVFTQTTPLGDLSVIESGFMRSPTALVRVGTMESADGTVTSYSAILYKRD